MTRSPRRPNRDHERGTQETSTRTPETTEIPFKPRSMPGGDPRSPVLFDIPAVKVGSSGLQLGGMTTLVRMRSASHFSPLHPGRQRLLLGPMAARQLSGWPIVARIPRTPPTWAGAGKHQAQPRHNIMSCHCPQGDSKETRFPLPPFVLHNRIVGTHPDPLNCMPEPPHSLVSTGNEGLSIAPPPRGRLARG
jgi:hypothetical protein